MTAIQMATINSAEAYRIDHMVGSICPGRIADILFVDDLEAFGIKESHDKRKDGGKRP